MERKSHMNIYVHIFACADIYNLIFQTENGQTVPRSQNSTPEVLLNSLLTIPPTKSGLTE